MGISEFHRGQAAPGSAMYGPGRRSVLLLAFLLCLAMFGASTRAAPASSDLPSPCSARQSGTGKSAAPKAIGLGQQVTVTLRLALDCPSTGFPMDFVLLIDRSSSMAGRTMVETLDAAIAFVDEVSLSRSRVGVISFAQRASIDSELSRDRMRLERAIRGIEADGDTNISAGLATAGSMLARSGSPPGGLSTVILLTDGRDNYGPSFVEAQADVLKAMGVHIVTIGLGYEIDRALLSSIASSPDDAYLGARSAELAALYRRLAGELGSLSAREVILRDVLPEDMRYVDGSARPKAEFRPGRVLEWRLPALPQRGITLSYRLQPEALGERPTNVEADARYIDSEGRSGFHLFEVPRVRVLFAPPTSTPTPSATPTASFTPSASPSSSPTPSPSATPDSPSSEATPTGTRTEVATATPAAPRPIYLPLALSGACHESGLPLDIVLVLDASTTMEQPSADGRRKLDIAIEAVRGFVAQVQPAREHMALISFNRQARLLVPLTSDLERLLAHLEQLPIGLGSHIDAGLDMAALALEASERPGARALVVLLTDGVPAGTTPAAVEAAARRLDAAGALVYVVGLSGPGSNLPLMRAIAGDPSRYLDAGDGARLVEAYREIAGRLACPLGGPPR